MDSKELQLKIKLRQGQSRSEKKAVHCPLHFADIVQDLNAGILLNQIVYWNSADDNGKIRLRVIKDGEFCLAKTKEDWWKEIRLTSKQIRRCEKILKDYGLIKTIVKKFNGVPTTHIFLNWGIFLQLEEKALIGQMENDQREQKSDTNGSEGVKNGYPQKTGDNLNGKSCVNDQREVSKVTKGHYGKLPKGIMESDQREVSLTESTTEITTTTTTENKKEEEKPSNDLSPLRIKFNNDILKHLKSISNDEQQALNSYNTWFDEKEVQIEFKDKVIISCRNEDRKQILNSKYKILIDLVCSGMNYQSNQIEIIN